MDDINAFDTEMRDYFSKNAYEWIHGLKDWLTNSDSGFTDIIGQEMEKSMKSGIMSPLMTVMMVSVKKIDEADPKETFVSAFNKVFGTLNEVWVIKMNEMVKK